jgi:phage N-6-adenine-methyltransferase
MIGRGVLLCKGKNVNWRTPVNLWNKLNKEFNFTLDAASDPENPLGTPKFYTKLENGLYQPWYNVTYCNPPYGKDLVEPWLHKARLEQTNGVTSVFLLPSRTGTNWFHRNIYKKPDVEIEFLKGRLQFGDSDNSAPFDSMIVIFLGHGHGRGDVS